MQEPYVVHPQWLRNVRAWYFDCLPDELAWRAPPDDGACIELSWRQVGAEKVDVEVRPLSPDEARELERRLEEIR